MKCFRNWRIKRAHLQLVLVNSEIKSQSQNLSRLLGQLKVYRERQNFPVYLMIKTNVDEVREKLNKLQIEKSHFEKKLNKLGYTI